MSRRGGTLGPTARRHVAVGSSIAAIVLRIEDGLPKMKDMPKEMGGSGESVPE